MELLSMELFYETDDNLKMSYKTVFFSFNI